MDIRDDLQLIRKRLDEAENIAIFSHIRPDGDSIGSVLALGWALEDIGKKVQYVSEDDIPSRFDFLFQYTADGKNPFVHQPDHADCYVTPDISSDDRAGRFFLDRPGLRPDICIDHHVSNTGVGKLNWIEADEPAVCCVMAKVLPQMGFEITKRISTALLCGIITDTNAFTNCEVTGETLRLASELVEKGAPLFETARYAYKEHTLPEMEYWKLGMNNMHIDGGLIWSVIRKKEREAIGYFSDDDPGFVSYLVNTKGIKVSVLFTEISENETKLSWRSVPGYDVAAVAVAHGGGGHAPASGAEVQGNIDDVIPVVLKKTKEMLFSQEG